VSSERRSVLPVKPEAAITAPASASPVTAFALGEDCAEPVSPDCADPSVLVRVSPDAAWAAELPADVAVPELPPLPVGPDVADASAAPPSPDPPPEPAVPDVEPAVPLAAPLRPELPPAPDVAAEVPLEVACEAPVLPPVERFVVVAEPLLPLDVEPELDADAMPLVPPPEWLETEPELPDPLCTTTPPVPPPLPPPLPPLPFPPLALPLVPELPLLEPPPALPLWAEPDGELVALPELPECDEPLVLTLLEPDFDVLDDDELDEALPELPPGPVEPEEPDPAELPPEPEPPEEDWVLKLWAGASGCAPVLLAAECRCAASTSSTSMGPT
jgi:hypothetical protein